MHTLTNYNPFHGGTTKVDKMGITKKQFESDKYKDYVRNDYESNEFFEIWIHPETNESVLVKLKK